METLETNLDSNMVDSTLNDSTGLSDLSMVDLANQDNNQDVFEPEMTDSEFAAMMEENLSNLSKKRLSRGDVVKGRIIRITTTSVFVDLGSKSEGILDAGEVKNSEGECTVSVGDLIESRIVGSMEDEGAYRLSRVLTRSPKSKELIFDAYKNCLPVEGKVISKNKGGYDVQIAGMKAFVPLSQIDRQRGVDPDSHIDQVYHFRIMEFKEGGRNIILSRSVLQKESMEARAKELRENLREGDVLSGTVSSIRDFGAFVDVGGVEGLLPVSEISWGRVKHPSDFLKEGDAVTVQLLKFDRTTNKMSFSMKQMGSSPWDDVGFRFVVGGIYTGKVVKLEAFGAFVELEPGLDGLLHVSNLVWEKRINHPKDVLNLNDTVTVQILEIDLDKRRIALGMKQLSEDPWSLALEKYPVSKEVSGTVERVGNFGAILMLEPGISGLVPISELGIPKGSEISKHVHVGAVIKVQVLEVNLVDRKILLSKKSVEQTAEQLDFNRYKNTQKTPSEQKNLGTLADMFAKATEKKPQTKK